MTKLRGGGGGGGGVEGWWWGGGGVVYECGMLVWFWWEVVWCGGLGL